MLCMVLCKISARCVKRNNCTLRVCIRIFLVLLSGTVFNQNIAIQTNLLHKFTPSSMMVLHLYPSKSTLIYAFCLYLQQLHIQYLFYLTNTYNYICSKTGKVELLFKKKSRNYRH